MKKNQKTYTFKQYNGCICKWKYHPIVIKSQEIKVILEIASNMENKLYSIFFIQTLLSKSNKKIYIRKSSSFISLGNENVYLIFVSKTLEKPKFLV